MKDPFFEKFSPFSHLVLFDGECPLCQHSVRFIYSEDRKEAFCFSPLGGKTAKKLFHLLGSPPPSGESVVLIENIRTIPKVRIEAEASLRILWLLGGKWKLMGWLYFVAPWGGNAIYRWIARHRHRLMKLSPIPFSEGIKKRLID